MGKMKALSLIMQRTNPITEIETIVMYTPRGLVWLLSVQSTNNKTRNWNNKPMKADLRWQHCINSYIELVHLYFMYASIDMTNIKLIRIKVSEVLSKGEIFSVL